MADKTLTVKIVGDNTDLKQKMNESVSSTSTAMKSIAMSLASAGAGMKLLGTIAEGINFNKAAEQAQVSFEVMTGSAKEAQQVLQELRDFAENTPLEFKDIRDATQTLLAFGIESEDAVSAIKMLGDVSGGNAEKLKSLALVFGQISANGRLTGGDLLQLVNSGFNPLQEMAERTGKSMTDLRKAMSDGEITFAMVEESFKNVTAEGGRFYGMLDKQSETLEGKVSTMNDAISVSMGKLAEAFTGVIKFGAEVVTALAEGFNSLPAGVQAFGGVLTVLTGVFLTLAGAVGVFTSALAPILGPGAIAAISAFVVAAGPFLAIGAAVAAIGVGIAVAFNASNQKAIEDAGVKFGGLANAIGKTEAEMEEFLKSVVKGEKGLGQLDDIIGNFGGDTGAVSEQFQEIADSVGLTADELARVVITSGEYSSELTEVAKLHIDINKQAEITARLEAQRFEAQRKAYAEAAENFYRLNPQIARARDEQRLRDQESAAASAKQLELSRAIQAINDAIARGGLSEIEGNKLKIQLREKEIASITEQLALGQRLSDSEVNRIATLQQFNRENQASIDQAVKATESAEEKKAELIADTYEGQAEWEALRLKISKDVDEAIIQSRDQVGKETLEREEQLAEARKAKQEAIKANLKEEVEANKKAFEEIKDLFMSFLGELDSAQKALTQARIEDIEAQLEADLMAIDAKTQATLEAAGVEEDTKIEKLQKELAKAIEAGDLETAAEKQDEIERTKIIQAAEAEKLAATKTAESEKAKLLYASESWSWKLKGLSILADTAKAIMTGYAQLGPVAGSIAAVALGGIGVAQGVAWEATKPQAPKLYTGTTNPIAESAPFIVGDQGVEMVLPKGAEVLNNRDTMGMMGGGGMRATIQVVMDSMVIAEQTANIFNNGLVRLEVTQ